MIEYTEHTKRAGAASHAAIGQAASEEYGVIGQNEIRTNSKQACCFAVKRKYRKNYILRNDILKI
jgi:hypothetical protein